MRKSAAVKLTLVPLLAASALAYAQPAPDEPPIAPPGMSTEVLMPPGMTPSIDDLSCEEDPNWQLRNDCEQVEIDGERMVVGTDVVRGGYGGYFWTGGG